MSENGVTQRDSRRWLVQAPPVGVDWDSVDSDLAGVVVAAVRSGAELTIEQHTVVQVGPATGPRLGGVSAPGVIEPVVTGVTVTPVNDPVAVRCRSSWVAAGIAAGCVVVGGLAVLVVVLFVMWVVAGLAAVAAWLATVVPYVLGVAAVAALVMLFGVAKTGRCPGLHCPGPH